ncbi:MAG: hypothetical protein NTY96_13100 [Bacteroidetes bacterium]|nr:hypothetical protein [Bacteroidota bacterium]
MGTPEDDKMPHWAKRIDEFGPRRWHREKEYRNRRTEFVSSIVFNLIALFVLYKLPDWHLGFITGKYGAVMYILLFSCLIQIGGNLLMLLLNFRSIRYISGIFMEAASFLAQITLYYIYPLDFSNYPGLGWIDIIFPWILIIGMVISAIKIFSNIWKLIFWR